LIVLDASALLAVLLREPGDDVIEPHLNGALMSSANLAEVLSKLAERGEDPDLYADEIRLLGVSVEPLTEAQARDVARLRPLSRSLGLSLGDRVCLALARERGATVLTTDRRWLDGDFGVEVQLGR
jgi:PIN domain nuclease of toxin-antitoxin system